MNWGDDVFIFELAIIIDLAQKQNNDIMLQTLKELLNGDPSTLPRSTTPSYKVFMMDQ